MAEASSSSPTNRFVPLSTHHLSLQPPLSETTLPSLLERSEQLADEAREALPYSFDECTYNKGYLRQSVWSCIDCGEKGVCYGCSISCHAEHKLVELWTRRHFRCDCPTTSMPETSAGKRRKCILNPPHAQPQQPNEENRYGPNYAGKFCRCGRDYDAETETEAMINCIACEDWFHEACLNLQPPRSAPTIGGPVAAGATDCEEDDDDDDEEKQSLIPSDSYDGLICAACVKGHPYLNGKAGQDGWMIIEPKDDGVLEVVGKSSASPVVAKEEDVNVKEEAAAKEENTPKEEKLDNKQQAEALPATQDRGQRNVIESGASGTIKRTAEDEIEESTAKKARVEEVLVKAESSDKIAWKGHGDVFLAYGQREKLKAELDPETVASLPFPLDDEEIYEPPQDDEEDETLDEVTSRVVGSLPRVQAIEALHGYQQMKDKLKTMLAAHAQDGSAVSREDIESFFQQLQAGRAGRT